MKKILLSLSSIILVGTTAVLTSCSMKSTTIDINVKDSKNEDFGFTFKGDGIIQGFAQEFLELFTFNKESYQGIDKEDHIKKQIDKLGQDAVNKYSFLNWLNNKPNLSPVEKDIQNDYFGTNNFLTKTLTIENHNDKTFGTSTPLIQIHKEQDKDKKDVYSKLKDWNSINKFNEKKTKDSFEKTDQKLSFLGKNAIEPINNGEIKTLSDEKQQNKLHDLKKEGFNIYHKDDNSSPELSNNVYFYNVGEVDININVLDPQLKNSKKYNVEVKLPSTFVYLRLVSKTSKEDAKNTFYWLEPFAYGFTNSQEDILDSSGSFKNFKNIFKDCGAINYTVDYDKSTN
ncbi:hypothetical protein [Spiroplasma endosymbiont of Crioceris asparagi]|uniref:hypothetical protein n=1 Tax=Spiroplasma endosymbiont of Crioceris asparagi TaxID=3066286 RepID=UPI0030CFB64C